MRPLLPLALAGLLAASASGQSVAQQAYVKASNTDPGDRFGRSVAVDGDTVVVGANEEASNSRGVNGNEADDSAALAGAAYVLVRDGTTWSQQAYVKASNTGAGDEFGRAVAIDGDTLVVGAFAESSNATGIDGDASDDSAAAAGAVYVYTRSGASWTQQAYIKASNTDAGDRFGRAVSIDGDTLVVGAPREDSAATGVGGDENDDTAVGAGAVYVFTRSGTVWSQQAYLKASNTDAGDQFGIAVSVSGDTLVAGAFAEASNATGVDGDESDDSAASAGAAYVFTRSGSVWSQQAYLKASDTDADDLFGRAVALDGDTVVVGAQSEDSGATGIDGDDTDDSATDAGAAYVFVRSGSTWSQQAYLKASNTDAFDQFGIAVSVDGDTAVVGAQSEDSGATGVDGDEADDGASAAGAAYVFTRSGATWSQHAYLKASNTGADDLLGNSAAVSGTTIVVGALQEDSNAVGIDGDGGDDSAADSGAAYVIDLEHPWEDLGSALAGLLGDPRLVGNGSLEGGEPVAITLSDTLPSTPAFLFLGLSALNFSPFFGGTLVPDFTVPPGQLIVVVTDGSGGLTLGSTWPVGVPPGFVFYLQYWIDDPAGPFGFSASNAIKGTAP